MEKQRRQGLGIEEGLEGDLCLETMAVRYYGFNLSSLGCLLKSVAAGLRTIAAPSARGDVH